MGSEPGCDLNERPRVAHAGAVNREHPIVQQAFHSALQGGDLFFGVEQLGHVGRRGPCERRYVFEQASGMGSPAKSQITVRSLKLAEKQSPWSIPRTRPSSPRSTCPLLRSVLLVTKSNRAMRASSRWVYGA